MGIPIVSEKYVLARLKAGKEIDHMPYLMEVASDQFTNTCYNSHTQRASARDGETKEHNMLPIPRVECRMHNPENRF